MKIIFYTVPYILLAGFAVFLYWYQPEEKLGGTIISTFQGGTASSTLSAGKLLYGNNQNPVGAISTTTATCSGTVSCSTHTILGSSAVTLSGGGLSGYDAFSHTTNFNQSASATTTALWLQGSAYSLFASST